VLLASPCACCGLDTGDFLDLAGGDGQNRICVSCREDPEAVARCLLKLARAGEPDLGLLARYDLVRELGRGGMGAVYLVRHVSTGEETALKLMLPKSAGTPKGRARFLREATLASSLRHQNIVESYGTLTAAGVYCFTSQYCPGGSLAQLLHRSRGRVSADEAISLILQVLNGLDHAHRSGVVHRDLSPGNILLGKASDGAMVAKVGDFGLGKLFDQAGLSGLTQTGDAAGKPAYVPRQQVINFRYAKPAVDVWAAAACLYRMLTGTCPRDFPPGQDPWRVVLDDPAIPIRQRDPSVPAALADIIDWALHDDPDISCQNAAELRDLLHGFLQK
jgi:serine/threonine protein kinase